MNTLLVVAGEASGDMHGAEILAALKKLRPGLRIVGVGGAGMRPHMDRMLADTSGLGVIGFFEVARHLPRILELGGRLLELAEEENAGAALLIDYQSFNLRLAKALRRRRPWMRLHQYVCPQVWAWKKGRIPVLGATLDTLYCLFDFEPPLFGGQPVEAVCLGHPLADLVRPETDRETFFAETGLDPGRPLVALLPGSREGELKRLLPAMLGLVRAWGGPPKRDHPENGRPLPPQVQWVLPVAPTLDADSVRARMGGLPIKVVENRSYASRAYADAALVCSGTATLETAMLGTPFAILYRMNPLSLAMARRLVKIKHFGLANIVAGREVARELLQGEVTPENLRRELARLLDPANAAAIRGGLASVKGRLGGPGAAERVAWHLASRLAGGESGARASAQGPPVAPDASGEPRSAPDALSPGPK